MIRVFPHKTSWTPDDDLAFIGDPPLFYPQKNLPVRVSCVFTWDMNEAVRLKTSWKRFYSDVEVGGPAFEDPGVNFKPGVFIKQGATITSRGCSKNCPWCFVRKREGWIRELPIVSGWNVADNNLLACSRPHIEAVFDMLQQQPKPIKFSGGLDAELLQQWHVNLLKTIRLKYAWFACDYPGAIKHIKRTADLLADFSREKKRCYVLIGFDGESIRQAEKRLEAVYKLDFLPMAMLYQPPEMEKPKWSGEWLKLRRLWCRPAAYKAKMKNKTI